MVEMEFAEKAAQLHALAAELAAAITTEITGVLAASVLPEILGAVRQGELATCRLVERVDRTGEYAGDGANSTVVLSAEPVGETNPWASERVHLGRALVDQMPTTAAAWQAGDIGLTHASVIRKASRPSKMISPPRSRRRWLKRRRTSPPASWLISPKW